jgi:predicted deacylase|tara:strand:- start:2960 stop:4048 length:1089 start_codon:yes stop_codon:yes gene_type:complete
MIYYNIYEDLKMYKLSLISTFLFIISSHSSLFAQKNEIITIGELSAAPGERISGTFSINSNDNETFVPISIVNGKNPGPTLLLVAGIHGSEYSPIIALQRLMPALDVQNLSGAVIAIHIANVPSYLGRTIYTSPADGKNLNRSFPGKADGSLTERIAYFLTNEVYPLADAMLDIHSGDGNEQLRPSWVGYYAEEENLEVVEASRKMAMVFGLQYANAFKGSLTPKSKAIWAGSAAVAMGIPSIDVEAGGMGIINPYAIDQIETGIKRIMDLMGIQQSALPLVPEPIIFGDRHTVNSPVDGSWYPLINTKKMVEQGELIGYVTDWYGKCIFEAKAPISGMLILRLEAPPVNKGELLITVAELP